jgi:hypothetical protein
MRKTLEHGEDCPSRRDKTKPAEIGFEVLSRCMTDRELDALIEKLVRDMRRREAAVAEIERQKYERKRQRHSKKTEAVA